MNKKWKIRLFVLIILAIGVFLVAEKRKKPEVMIKEVVPVYGGISTFISTTGTVAPQNRLEIKPPINGRIEEILISEGQQIKTGQILAWMSSTERAALLDAARSKGEEEFLYWKDVYKATPLISPIKGEVIVRAVEPGQTVASTDAVVVLSDRLIIKAQVDETDIGKVKLGQEAMISLDAYPQIKVKGTVDHISYESEVVNNVTIYEVDVLPEKIPDVFRSGMSANVEIVEKSKKDILLIPWEAVKTDMDGSFVFIRNKGMGKLIRRKVELGISDEKNIEVVSGISVQDKIVIEGTKFTLPRKNNGGTNPFVPFGRGRR